MSYATRAKGAGDIMERVDSVFYGDPLTAAMKALSMS